MQDSLHPLHAVLLAGTVPLFLGVLFADMAYYFTHQVQWKNFASWLLVGGLLFGGAALLWSLIARFRAGWHDARASLCAVLLLAMWILGLINAFVHASDAWASMPTGLVLAAIVAPLAMLATALGYSGYRARTLP